MPKFNFIESEDLSSIIRWAMVIGLLVYAVSSMRGCSETLQSDADHAITNLVNKGHDPIIARCTIEGSSHQSGTSTTCAMAVFIQAMEKSGVLKDEQ